jgi:hypothetical protein
MIPPNISKIKFLLNPLNFFIREPPGIAASALGSRAVFLHHRHKETQPEMATRSQGHRTGHRLFKGKHAAVPMKRQIALLPADKFRPTDRVTGVKGMGDPADIWLSGKPME